MSTNHKTEPMEYRASLDMPAKILTVLCFLLFGYIIYSNSHLKNIPVVLSILITVSLFATFITAFLFAPSRYIVSNDSLIIVRPANKVIIRLSEIKEARLLLKNEIGTLIRTWGSGGLFGYYGHFRSTRLGKLKLYTTRRNNRILITTVDDYRLVISPDDTSILSLLCP